MVHGPALETDTSVHVDISTKTTPTHTVQRRCVLYTRLATFQTETRNSSPNVTCLRIRHTGAQIPTFALDTPQPPPKTAANETLCVWDTTKCELGVIRLHVGS